MSNLFLGNSNSHLFFQDQRPKPVWTEHDAHFWAYAPHGSDHEAVRRKIEAESEALFGAMDGLDLEAIEHHGLKMVRGLGPLETVKSPVAGGKDRLAFKVHTWKPQYVPILSDLLFKEHGVFTAEHDIHYKERVALDLAAQDKAWFLDTKGEEKTLKVLVYDVETTQYGQAAQFHPVDIIGAAEFEVGIRSSKDLDKEEFNFEVTKAPPKWDEVDVQQVSSKNRDEELQNLLWFIERVKATDIVSGHNILTFDNKKVRERVQSFIEQHQRQHNLSKEELASLKEFRNVWSSDDKLFQFGRLEESTTFYPTSLDTHQAARLFYFFHDQFGLKDLSKFLGIKIPGRIVVAPSDMKVGDPKTMLYNVQDVQEQVALTGLLLNQALPYAFVHAWPFEECLQINGNTKRWDHLAMLRAVRQNKLITPTVKASYAARSIYQRLGSKPTKQQIVDDARKDLTLAPPMYTKLAKMGDEMPDWVTYPTAIINPSASNPYAAEFDLPADGEEEEEETEGKEISALSFATPGGLTVHPQELKSQFVPFWFTQEADVSAMYPTTVRAMNVGPDTVRLARQGEVPDDWVWLKKLNAQTLIDAGYQVKPPAAMPQETLGGEMVDSEESFTNGEGWMVGIKIDKEPGLVPLAMKGIMYVAANLKRKAKAAKKNPDLSKDEVDRIQMAYDSIKAARNAGTHGLMLAASVSCRGFNLWAGCEITTMGQRILSDARTELENAGGRLLMADTDGLYFGCGKAAASDKATAESLGIPQDTKTPWITNPEKLTDTIKLLNTRWQERLQYHDFEFEAASHAALLPVVHKNYVYLDVKAGKLKVTFKGNNFKGKDKPKSGQKVLEEVMLKSYRDHLVLSDEAKAAESMQRSIKKHTLEAIKTFDATKADLDDLTITSQIRPIKEYKPGKDGTSVWIRRAEAMQALTKETLKVPKRYRLLVCKQPLPGIDRPSKAGIKRLDFSWPAEMVTKDMIDFEFYKDAISKYVTGAFGFEDLEPAAQQGIEKWM